MQDLVESARQGCDAGTPMRRRRCLVSGEIMEFLDFSPVSRNRGKTPGRFGDRPYRSAFGYQKTAEFRALRSDGERMLHLRARTFAPITLAGNLSETLDSRRHYKSGYGWP